MSNYIKKKKNAEAPVKNDESQKIFVDREIQRNIFKKYLGGISHEGSLLMYYSGAGGIGKTALLDKLQKYLNTKKQIFKSVYYNFTTSADIFPLTALEDNFADEFLKESSVENSALREGITKLTGGYPNYLSLCVDMYKKNS